MFSANVLPTSEKYLQNAFAISFGFCIILVLMRNLSFIELLSFNCHKCLFNYFM